MLRKLFKPKPDIIISKRDGVWRSELTGEEAPPELVKVAERQKLERARVQQTLLPGVFFVKPVEDGNGKQ
jgi:hypothetical protein